MLLVTAIGCFWVVLASFTLPDIRRIGNFIVLWWGTTCCRILGLKIEVQGLENIPEGGCLFIFNHTSHVDIPIFYASVPKPARFGAKAELFKIPIFGWVLRRMGALKINRGDRAKVIRLYQDSVKRVAAGHSFVLAAEGTRIDHAGVGKVFKSGPMIFAISGQFPIVPVVFVGAQEVLPKGRLFPVAEKLGSAIKVKILPMVSTVGLSIDDRRSLKASLQVRMTKAFLEG